MKVAVIAVYNDPHRRGAHHRSILQPQIGPLIAALLPSDADVEVVNDTWTDPDWSQRYDLVFLSCMHSDFDRARQIAHYYRRRGSLAVLGGTMATTFPGVCAPYFDAVAIGDPEDTVPAIYADALAGHLKAVYQSSGFQADGVPTPRVEQVTDQQVVAMSMEATRGCPFTCDFCALTGAGTRFMVRSVDSVLEDLDNMDRALAKRGVPRWKRRFVSFYDNNLAGNMPFFRDLCAALESREYRWGTCVTFNVLTNRDLLRRMYRAGCRTVFVGLESFNPEAIEDFNKQQNRLTEVRRAFDTAIEEGILVTSGLMLSPLLDDEDYIESIPQHLKESGLHVPAFVCIETAIPGTPLFSRLAASEDVAFMPNATLEDFNAYSLVIRPAKMSPEAFVSHYRWLLDTVYSSGPRWRKLLDDGWRLLKNGSFLGAALATVSAFASSTRWTPGRTFIPGTDPEFPERVPLTEADFPDADSYRAFMAPTPVTDADGRVLPEWLEGISPMAQRPGRSSNKSGRIAVENP